MRNEQVGRGLDWHTPTSLPALEAGQAHVWRVRLEAWREQGDLRAILTEDEIARAQRLRIPEKRADFVTARAALRTVLASYIGLTPRQVELAYLPDGKPQLADPLMAARLQFNLSHSGEWMLLALSRGLPLGVDIERIHPLRAQGWALAQLFNRAEREVLNTVPQAYREAAFIAAWTLKEAVGKADGRGIRAQADTTDLLQAWFSQDEAQPYRYGKLAGYSIAQFNPAPGYCAALALAAVQPVQLRFLNLEKARIETV
ncbi:4'-phosphopantetheinyl transferase family protein [Pelolinea submarina]|nr:4'-phosphopantetheinyl transferase superfamily protein [Pelolinea submarina]